MISLGLADICPRPRTKEPFESADGNSAVSTANSSEGAALLQSLVEAATWCSHGQAQSERLRSLELDPSRALKVPSLEEVGIDIFVKVMRDSYQSATMRIQQRRSTLIKDKSLQKVDRTEAQSSGKLLLYEPMETVQCGASAASSHDFFDIEDAPPWDTWFWSAKGTIFCWVPYNLVPYAQAGINVNPVDCIHWAKWSELKEKQ